MAQRPRYPGMPPDGAQPAFSPTSANAPEVTPWSGTPGASPRAELTDFTDQTAYGPQSAKYPSSWPYEERVGSSDGRDTMSSPGLGSMRYIDSEKESYQPRPRTDGIEVPASPPSKIRICGMPFWLLLTVLGVLIAVAVGLAVGLGLGLGKEHKESSAKEPPVTSSPSPNYYSTTGVFNGSGIALATQSFGQDTYGTVVVYFQHWTGQIRYMQLTNDGSWQGGDEKTVVATDARNGTPIAAVAYAMNGVSTWHIFYIDKNHILQEQVNGNTSNLWSTGPLGSYNFRAMDDPNVALQGCWEGYRPGGQINAIPLPNENGQHYTSSSQTLGINLWYGVNPTRIESANWAFGSEVWTRGNDVFDAFNAHAGVGCYSWGPGTVTYLVLSDLSDAVNIWWKDLDETAVGTSTHPVGSWTNSSIAIPNSFQNTSVGYTEFLYAQDSDLNLVGYNVSWNAENTAFVVDDAFTIQDDVALAGTHMTVTSVSADSGGHNLLVFNQIEGDSITEFTRDLEQGQWTMYKLPIPDQ